MKRRSTGSFYRSALLLAIGSLLIASAALSVKWDLVLSATPVTWDGGGATNNWSEAANWTGDIVPGAGNDVIFDATSIKDVAIDVDIIVSSIKIDAGYTGTITQADAASITVSGCSGRPCFRQDGGTFSGSSNTITLTGSGFGAITMTGGAFNGGSGDIVGNSAPNQFDNFLLQGGTFQSTSGTLTVPDSLIIQGSSFVNNSGTVVFVGNQSTQVSSGAADIFNNVAINKPDANLLIGGRLVVAGSLALDDGSVSQNGTVIESRGDLIISPNFDGGNSTLELANGSGPRNFTFSTDLTLPKVIINDPSVTIDTSGTGTLHFPHQLILQQGTFNQGSVDLLIEPLNVGGGSCYSQNGGVFNGSSNSITLKPNGFGAIFMNGGTFNGGSGDITFIGAPGDNANISLQGGTFRSTGGTLTVPGNFLFQGVGTTFLHNSGTVNFTAGQSVFLTGDSNHPSITFNNVNLNLGNGVNFGLGPTVIVQGDLNLNDGSIGQLGTTVEAQGTTVIGSNFDGGPTNFRFGGGVNQTFTNSGGVNPTGTWTVNKTSGTVTAATDVILGTSQALNITSGSLFLADGSDLTVGALTLGATGKLINDSSTTITLGGNLSNAGVIDLQGSGAGCPENDTLLLRSSSPGTRRNISGSGAFRIADVDIQDMNAVIPITAFSSTDSGNNAGSFTFDPNCPLTLGISPAVLNTITAQQTTFTFSGGFGSRTFSFVQNNSGGTLSNAVSNTIRYTSGAMPDVTDVIRVTDALGNFADATINVTGPAVGLGFVVQPTSTGAGAPITPAIKVAIQDQAGVTVTSATNTIGLSIQNNPSIGNLSGTASTAAVNGVATFADLSIDRIGAGYTLRASSAGLSFATSTPFNVSVGAPTTLIFAATLPTVAIAPSVIPSVQVNILDAAGNLASDATNPVTIAIGNNPGGGALSGTLTRTPIGGTVTFDDLSISLLGNGYTLTATSPGLNSSLTNSFNVLGPAGLAFFEEQAQLPIEQNTSFILQVEVQDQFGNRFTNANNDITVAIGNNPSGGTLSGTKMLNASNGLAVFSGISIDNPGDGYTFVASSSSLTSATSSQYNVVDPFVVTRTDDNGLLGTLSRAIQKANSVPGTQTISFNLPGPGPFVISSGGIRTAITDSAIIDGTTQPGYAGSPIVELDGNGNHGSPALKLQSNNSVIKGLSVTNATSGIVVQGNRNTVEGNLIGISPNGLLKPIFLFGISIQGQNNIVGGPTANERNVISGSQTGVLIFGGSNNLVRGNFIGTDMTGTQAAGNLTGVNLSSSGTNSVRENVISGNLEDGIQISEDSDLIENNIIGLDATGIQILGNSGSGIVIGDLGSENHLSSNRIFGNGRLGITLGNRVVNASGSALPNDPLDPDIGANEQQNYPVIALLDYQPTNIVIGGSLHSVKSSAYTLEFFSSPSCDPSGNGEGAVFLGSGNVSTDSVGNGPFSVILPVTVDSSQFITATATDANGNTSEFSQCKGPQLTIQGNVKNTSAQPIAGATVKVHNNTTDVDTFLTTNSLGHYVLANQSQGQTYAIDAAKTNFQVLSSSTQTDGNGNIDKEFTMQQTSSTVSGHVTLNGTSLSGVTLKLSGSANATASTDSSGNYSFAGLSVSGTYTVTPSLQNFIFSPPSSTFSGATDHITNFTATNLLASLPGRFVFAANGAIKTMNADGSGIATVLPRPRSSSYKFPSFSADGRTIVFDEQATNSTTDTLRFSGADGSGNTSLVSLGTTPPTHQLAFSPDGTFVATDRLSGGIAQLVKITKSNGAITPLVTTGFENVEPDWSPDGTKIVFARALTFRGQRAIFTVNADGTDLVKMTNPTLADFEPKWSPDGTKIAFLRSVSGLPTQLCIMNGSSPLSTPQVILTVPINSPFAELEWAPDGSRLAVTESSLAGTQLVTILPDGTGQLVISSNLGGPSFDWGPTTFVFPPIGNNINVNLGNINLGFTGITGLRASSIAAGSQSTIDAELISPASVGPPPPDYVLGEIAYQIITTASFTPPVSVCIDIPSDQYPTAASFNETSLLHDEGGTIVDVTTSHDFALHRICGNVDTLGNFVIANHINTTLPRISGLVVDQNGDPLDDFTIALSGDATQQSTTGSDGSFSFVNLTDGGSYLVTPTSVGYVYSPPFQGYDSLSGEQTVVFVATPATFSISGTITDGNLVPQDNVTVTLSGGAEEELVTDSAGTYSFDSLPANGTYFVTPSLPGTSFAPQQLTIDALQNDIAGADFMGLLPTAAPVSISGRAVRANGQGIGSARLTLMSSTGKTRTTLTNAFGYYHFDNVEAGSSYVLGISSKTYQFANATRVLNVNDEISGEDFTALP